MRVKLVAYLQCDRDLVPELAAALTETLYVFDTEAELRVIGWPLDVGELGVSGPGLARADTTTDDPPESGPTDEPPDSRPTDSEPEDEVWNG